MSTNSQEFKEITFFLSQDFEKHKKYKDFLINNSCHFNFLNV